VVLPPPLEKSFRDNVTAYVGFGDRQTAALREAHPLHDEHYFERRARIGRVHVEGTVTPRLGADRMPSPAGVPGISESGVAAAALR